MGKLKCSKQNKQYKQTKASESMQAIQGIASGSFYRKQLQAIRQKGRLRPLNMP